MHFECLPSGHTSPKIRRISVDVLKEFLKDMKKPKDVLKRRQVKDLPVPTGLVFIIAGFKFLNLKL